MADPMKSRTILLVDDEPGLLRMVGDILAADGFSHVVKAASVSEALVAFRRDKPDLALLDVMLPDGDGFTLCRFLRELCPDDPVPVIFLTAKDEMSDRLAGLRSGADDYVSKPFSPQELLLRIHAVLRRCYRDTNPALQLAACTVDLENVEVVRADGRTVSLTAKEHDLLEILARNANRIVTTDSLCEECWGSSFGYEKSLMTHVRRIREKIEADPSNPVSLVTVKGLGYKLLVEKGDA